MQTTGHVSNHGRELIQRTLHEQLSLQPKNFQTRGVAHVRYPEDLRLAVATAMNSWVEFCKLPRNVKAAFAFVEDDHGDGAGYELKEGAGESRDFKENFHVTLFQQGRLKGIAGTRRIPFLDDALALLTKMEPIIVGFAQKMEEQYRLAGFTDVTRASKPYWTLRYLHYFGNQPPNAVLAAPHLDKGGFTMHLYESDGGCQYFTLDSREWNPLPVGPEETVIFGGMQLQQISQGALKALYHRVVATENTSINGRFAMVCFVSLEGPPQYNKKVYGSMQTHRVAFNYDMPDADFQGLFKAKTDG